MSAAFFAALKELKAEITALTARVAVLEALSSGNYPPKSAPKLAPEPKSEPPRPTLSLSKRA